MMYRFPTFFIAAPFGNWIHHKNAVSVKGTFTLNPQGNRLWSILKTLRHTKDGWVNKLGLPNPGITKGLDSSLPCDILSIAEMNRNEFQKFNKIIPKNQSIELNLSCPNIGKTLPWDHIKIFPNKEREWCIAKMSPLSSAEEVDYVIHAGFTTLHFSNTLPVKSGGLSGKHLKPYTKKLIEIVRDGWKGRNIEIIAGGGVTTEEDVFEYLEAGANHISIGSGWFNYFKMKTLIES